MDKGEKKLILKKAQEWMRNSIIPSHEKNTTKLKDISKFNINPFSLSYLAYYLEGDASYESLAKVLIYPRVLGTSINTIMGNQFQKFMVDVLGAAGSTTHGCDIEFVDKIDGRKKYCQVKSGPNVLNKDDVKTISDHFQEVTRLARTNDVNMGVNDLVLGLLYGEPHEKNGNVKKLEEKYVVLIGKEFWYRFTGDEEFYGDLIEAIGEVAREVDMKEKVNEVIEILSVQLKEKYGDAFEKASEN